MAVNEPSEAIGVDELRLLEQSVLKALCLTINTAGSELKYKILDSLSDEDFYFPVNKSVFQTLSDMHLRGDYVISANLEEELRKSQASFPTGFSIERLFEGHLPSLTELNVWVGRIRERSRSGIIPSVVQSASQARPQSSPSVGRVSSTVVRSVDEVKKKIADAARKSGPGVADASVAPRPAAAPTPTPTPVPVPKPMAPPSPAPKPVAKPASSPAVAKSSPSGGSPRSSPSSPSSPAKPPDSRERSAPASFPDVSAARPAKKAVLSSEGDDWGDYLDDLASKQGKTFDTGFKKLDEGLGGLSPGLMLLVDEQRERISSFLKQLTDQFAQGSPMRCLYLATELQKTQLRIRTLGRLAGVSVKDIEKGRLKRDSQEWQRIEAAGKRASGWLKRVFVYEVEGELDLPFARELARKLIDSSTESTCTMVIDALEKVGRRGGSSSIVVSQLKALATSMDILVVAATSDPTLLGSKDADYAGVFRDGAGGVIELEVLQTGHESSVVTSLRYQPDICAFAEV